MKKADLIGKYEKRLIYYDKMINSFSYWLEKREKFVIKKKMCKSILTDLNNLEGE